MVQVRRAEERGYADHGWLKATHSFSFADYYDPSFMGFRGLRVMNEDRVSPANGFGTHPHRDMEIVTYILEGALEHKDSMGTGSTIRPGDIQYMSAGSGVLHSEFNPSKTESVHLYQIWILPNEKGAKPRYGQTHFTREQKLGKWRLLVSPTGEEGSLAIRADAKIFAVIPIKNESIVYTPKNGRGIWVQVARGKIWLNGSTELKAGDGVALVDEDSIEMVADNDQSEVLLFDLA